MTLKEEYDFLCDRIEDLKKQIKNAKERDVSPMTIQMKYMKNYQSILKYRIEKQIDLDESQTKVRRKLDEKEVNQMIQPWVFSIEWENHCRNCVHNPNDYWCDKYNCCPCQALTLCNADGFHFEEKKDD